VDTLFETYVISFVDLLGSRNAIKHDEVQFFLSVYQLLGTAKEMCETYGEQLGYSGIEMKAFSDNIVFAHKIPVTMNYDKKCEAIQRVISFTAIFQNLAFNNGILMRGGITIGKLCFNEMFVWGGALVDAYDLENTYAIFPRVLVDKKTLEALINTDGECKYGIPIYKDFDNQFYINFLGITAKASSPLIIHFAHLRISSLKTIYKGNAKVLQKIAWTESYIDKFQSECDISDEMILKAVERDKRLHDDIMSG